MAKSITNDELIETFRRMVDGEEDIPQRATNRLVLAALVDTRQGVSKTNDKMDGLCADVKQIRENELPHIASKVKEIDDRFIKNPSLIWLLRYRTSKTVKNLLFVLGIVIVLAAIFIGSPDAREAILKILGL